MLSGKRKQGFGGLQRRVRPRKEEEPEIDENLSSEPEEMDVEGDELSEGEEDEDNMDDGDDDQESDASPPQKKPAIDISSVSFGALAKAQASMSASSRRRKRGAAAEDSQEGSDSDSGPEEVGNVRKPKSAADVAKRTSKHAPTEMSSKKPVSRKREVIAVPKMEVRDPRFDPLSGPVDEAKAKKAYAFLDKYRADEMKELRGEIKKTKDPVKKEEMKRLLLSMESKIKARERKEREQELITEHKRREKELVKQGKQPFYLKKSEQKKRLLMDQFAGMKKRQVDRTIERKRKKVVARERKELDQLERRDRS
ncbi:rRNA processing protein [Colletotrichum truncatum]|uniref:rRNA processing protein n=1 Tax=Colletotrichum truncatum TaxID=5467 RepID=A0ACC3ZJ01_COLTU|nr:rRNA processing protein [Colletotrichum truncatum]KAF6791924.1 rRNA processing protein [Colletotrichum truncatum]